MWYGFVNCKSPFVNISCHLQRETLTDSMPFLSTYIDLRTVNFFPPAESWLLNLNLPRASRMEGGPTKLNPVPLILAFPQHLQRKPPKSCTDPEETDVESSERKQHRRRGIRKKNLYQRSNFYIYSPNAENEEKREELSSLIANYIMHTRKWWND